MGSVSNAHPDWNHHRPTGRVGILDFDIPPDPSDHDGIPIYAESVQ